MYNVLIVDYETYINQYIIVIKIIVMSQTLSPFQLYVSTWWTKEEAETKHHEIVRSWNKLTMSEQSQYFEAARKNKHIDKTARIFQV